MPISTIVSPIVRVASDRDLPGGRLNEMVEATNWPWWFTERGALPGPNEAIADSGIIVSFEIETAAPVDALVLPRGAIELLGRLRAVSEAIAAGVAVALRKALAPPDPPDPPEA